MMANQIHRTPWSTQLLQLYAPFLDWSILQQQHIYIYSHVLPVGMKVVIPHINECHLYLPDSHWFPCTFLYRKKLLLEQQREGPVCTFSHTVVRIVHQQSFHLFIGNGPALMHCLLWHSRGQVKLNLFFQNKRNCALFHIAFTFHGIVIFPKKVAAGAAMSWRNSLYNYILLWEFAETHYPIL